MKQGRRGGSPLQYAAARAALWLLNDLSAAVETLLFPDNVRTPVCAQSSEVLFAKLECTRWQHGFVLRTAQLVLTTFGHRLWCGLRASTHPRPVAADGVPV